MGDVSIPTNAALNSILLNLNAVMLKLNRITVLMSSSKSDFDKQLDELGKQLDKLLSKVISLATRINRKVSLAPAFLVGESCSAAFLMGNMSAFYHTPRETESTGESSWSWTTPNHPTVIDRGCNLSHHHY